MTDKEIHRLQALQDYDILHSAQEQFFDDITELTAYLFETPIARIAFVGRDEVWHKASVGMPSQELLPAEQSLCARVVARGDTVAVLEELGEAPSLMQERGVRLYAGALLRNAQGVGLGTLCVAGTEPRSFTARELYVLHCLADVVTTALEKRRQVLSAAGPDAWAQVERRASEALHEQMTLVRYLKARQAGVLPVPAEVLTMVCQRLEAVTKALR